MPWDRGAWERTTRGEGTPYGTYSPPAGTTRPVVRQDKTKQRLKENFIKFIKKQWKIPEKKKNQYLNNNYYNAPYTLPNTNAILQKTVNLINSKHDKSKILIVSNDKSMLNRINQNRAIKNKYRIYNSFKSKKHSEEILDTLDEFEKINAHLFEEYAVKIFQDTQSINQIPDLRILDQNLYYIDDNASKLLNEFIKCYWEFFELSNMSNIDLTMAERDVNSEISKVSSELTSIKNYIRRLEKIMVALDFDLDDLDKFDFELLKANPVLIEGDGDDFLKLLEKYQKLNSQGIVSSTYFNGFLSNNYILGVIANYKRYVESKNDYGKVNTKIMNLKKHFETAGLNITKLNDYYEIKQKLAGFENAEYVDNSDYIVLNDKIAEFLNSGMSFHEYFAKCRESILFNMDSVAINRKAKNSLNNIAESLNQLGVEINSLNDFDANKNNLKILRDYASVNDSENDSKETVKEYANKLFEELKSISNTLISDSGDVDDDLDYVMHNITTLKRNITQIGLNIDSLKDLKDSFLIIADVENDVSDDIFSPQTHEFLQNEQYIIHTTLDSVKSSLNYLYDRFKNQPDLMNVCIDELSETLNDQYRLRYFKSTIEGYCSSIRTFDEILANYSDLILNVKNLCDFNNDNRFESDLDRIQNEMDSIFQMHQDNDYSNSQMMANNVSSFKSSVIDKFDKLVDDGVFSKDKIDECDVLGSLNRLDENVAAVRDFIRVNGWYELDFKRIGEINDDIISANLQSVWMLDDANIYNFTEVCEKLNKPDNGYSLVQEILDLALKLDIDEYDDFERFTVEDIRAFSLKMDNDIEFSRYVDEGIITRDFKTGFYDFDSAIESIREDLANLKLDSSILDDFSQIDIGAIEDIRDKLTQLDNCLENDSTNLHEQIKNYKLLLYILLDLCNDYYIEFEIDNTKFNSSDFKFNLEQISNDLEHYIELYNLENEISSHENIIGKNLKDIWRGPLTSISKIKDKLQTDKFFTQLYKEGIYTQKSLDAISRISQSDLLFIEQFKTMEDCELKSKYELSYKNREVLIYEIENLDTIKRDDFKSLRECLLNINEIYKSDEIGECINLVEYHIQHDESIMLINEYERKLKTYSITYYKYFDRREFDLTIDEILSKLDSHLKFTHLIDSKVINERYIDSIKSNIDDFMENINRLDSLKDMILQFTGERINGKNHTFDEIRKNLNSLENSELVLMDMKNVKNNFNQNHIAHFTRVYIVNTDLADEDLLHLFLISKNKISNIKLRDG